jgi:hypothetical protein
LEERGDRKSVEVLSDIVTNTKDEGIRIAAATALAPYQFSKWQSSPVPRYIETPVDLPEPETVEQATQQIAHLGTLLASGQIELDFHAALVASRRAWIESRIGSDLEARILALEGQRSQDDDTAADTRPGTSTPGPDPEDTDNPPLDPADPRNWGVS